VGVQTPAAERAVLLTNAPSAMKRGTLLVKSAPPMKTALFNANVDATRLTATLVA